VSTSSPPPGIGVVSSISVGSVADGATDAYVSTGSDGLVAPRCR
jgi:hypothetical protein